MNPLHALNEWWLGRVWHKLVLPLGEPEFYTEDEAELARRLNVADLDLSAALLAEAEEIDRSQHESADSIQGRAMTLQGAVAIATTLTLTAGGLLLDRTKIESRAWRDAFAVVLLLTVATFIVSGVRALGASSRTHAWTYPGFNDIFTHAGSNIAWARATKAAAHLKAAGMNLRIVQVKGGYLNAAVFWFRIGLASLAALAAMFVAYTVWSQPTSSAPGQTHSSQPSSRTTRSLPR